MQRYALAPLGPTPEQILVTISGMARNWTIARRNRGVHRLLLPVDASLRALDALRYITEDVGHLVASVHLVNVQIPVATRDLTAPAAADLVAVLRDAAGQRIIALACESFSDSGIPVTGEVAFGTPAESICSIAEKRRCTGIVIGRTDFELHDLLRGSVAAKVLRLATVPVTVVSTRASAAMDNPEAKRSWERSPLAKAA
jgi:nucleotide-binding universal stress UspA family protein